MQPSNTLPTHSTLSLAPLSRPWLGAVFKIAYTCLFAGVNAIVHYLASPHSGQTIPLHSNVIMFFQNAIGLLFLLPLIFKTYKNQKSVTPFNTSKTFGTKHPWLHIIRVLTAVVGVGLWFLALKHLPLAEGVALQFIGPILTVLGGTIFLHEAISFKRGLAIMISIFGAFIITRPDIPLLGGNHPLGWAAILPILSAMALSINKLITRKLTSLGESPERLALYLMIFMTPISFIVAVFQWQTPEVSHWPWLILLGLISSLAHLSFAKAYQLAEVTFLTPFGFCKFLGSALLGYIIFAEVPSPKVWIGCLVIFASVLLLSNYKMPLYSLAKRFKSS